MGLASARRAIGCAGLLVVLVRVVLQRHVGGRGGDAVDYVDAARDLTGSSRFPVGFPALLAPFTSSWAAMEALTLVIALGLVITIWWAAVTVGGWQSGAAASLAMFLSPGLIDGGSAIMSDRLGALLLVGALLAVLHDRMVLAGVLVGLGGWVRLVHVAFVAALPRRAWPAAFFGVALLVAWQVGVKGSLLGYTSEGASFALANVTGPVSLEVIGNPAPAPNLAYFPAVLTIGLGFVFVPFLMIPGAIGLWRLRGSRGARFAAVAVAINLAVYLPYFFQSARFMLPAGCLLIVYAAAAVGHPDDQRLMGPTRRSR